MMIGAPDMALPAMNKLPASGCCPQLSPAGVDVVHEEVAEPV